MDWNQNVLYRIFFQFAFYFTYIVMIHTHTKTGFLMTTKKQKKNWEEPINNINSGDQRV